MNCKQIIDQVMQADERYDDLTLAREQFKEVEALFTAIMDGAKGAPPTSHDRRLGRVGTA